MPWPPFFTELYQKFTQISTHVTFLKAFSPQTIPTADHLLKLVPGLALLELQMIKYLSPPGDVTFDYFDENQLLLEHVEKVKYSWLKGYEQNQPKTLDDAYVAASQGSASEGPEKQLLVFEFCDVRTQGIGSKLKSGKSGPKRVRTEKDPLPFFSASSKMSLDSLSQQQLLAIIQARNGAFRQSIDTFLALFGEDSDGTAPMKTLVENCLSQIPSPPKLADPSSLLSTRTSAISGEKPELDEMVQMLKHELLFKGQIKLMYTLTKPRAARMAPLAPGIIHRDLSDALWHYKGVDTESTGLYLHQTQALSAIMIEQKHVIALTSTSSGKSLIYQIPILNDILVDTDAGRNAKKRTTTALLIFPTKALAQDQMRHLRELISYLPQKRRIYVDTYDGDTPLKDRAFIRNTADIIFTNPDAIHASILPNCTGDYGDGKGWSEFLHSLRYVILDELHVYKGTFGVHVSYVMARLNRLRSILTLNESIPIYISCSATIEGPEKSFRKLCAIPQESPILHVHDDGSPSTEKKMVIWEPPILMNKNGQRVLPQKVIKIKRKRRAEKDEVEAGGEEGGIHADESENYGDDVRLGLQSPIQSAFLPRESVIGELAKILVHLLASSPTIKAIVFCPIRAVCELLIKEVKLLIKKAEQLGFSVSEHDVMAYRGGYAKSDRRAIERKMFSGHLRAIVATNALELGIDLSDLDVVISCGFPMLKLNLHQQFGRAGRGKTSKGSLAILVCGNSPVDRYYLRNLEELCEKSYEDLMIEGFLDGTPNQMVLSMHLQCAAFEWPLSLASDRKWFSSNDVMAAKVLSIAEEKLCPDDNGAFRTHPAYMPWPAEKVSLRAIEQTMYAVVDITHNKNTIIEEVEELRTSFTLYEGGIFLHQGFPYLVKEFNPEGRYAKVVRVQVSWTTQQRDFSDVDPQEIELVKQLHVQGQCTDLPVFYGKIQTTIIVFGYFKVNRKGEILEAVEVKNPPVVLRSKGFWIDIPNQALDIIREKKLNAAGGIHAAQHGVMNILPLFITGGATTNPNAKFVPSGAGCELSTECKAPQKEFAQRQSLRRRPPRLIFHDSKGGEAGSGMASKTFEYIDEILVTAFERIVDCECLWGCPLCVAGTFCTENMLVMSKPAALVILAVILGRATDEFVEGVMEGPEPNMPEIPTESVATKAGAVKFAKNVQIVRETREEKKRLTSGAETATSGAVTATIERSDVITVPDV